MAKLLIICFLDSEIKHAVKLALQEKDSLVIALNGDISEFRKNNIRFKTLQDYALNEKLSTLPRLVYEHYVRWGELEISGKKLKEHLNSGGFDFWANVQATFCDKLYAGYTPKGLKFVAILKEIFLLEKPEGVWANINSDAGLAAKKTAEALGAEFHSFSFKLPKIKIRPLLAGLLRHTAIRRFAKLRQSHPYEKKKKILFIMSLPTSYNILLPVMEELKDRYEILCISTDLSENKYLRQQIESAGFNFANILEYNSKHAVKNAGRTYSSLKSALPKRLCFEFSGIDASEFISEVFGFYFWPRSYLKEVLLTCEFLKSVVEHEKPSMIVSMDESSDMSKPILDYSEKKGIRTMAIQHGPIGDTLYPAFNNTIAAGRLVVWGKSAYDFYLSHGVPADRLTICGNPKFDQCAKQTFDNEKILAKLGLNSGQRKILVANQIVRDMPKIIDCLVKYAKRTGSQLIIKIHPRENARRYDSLANEANVTVARNSVYQLISISDVVVTVASIVCLEAAVMGKPAILANFSGVPERLDYAKEGIALGVRDELELARALDSLTKESEFAGSLARARQAYFEKHLLLDGNSTTRIAAEIEKIIGNMQ